MPLKCVKSPGRGTNEMLFGRPRLVPTFVQSNQNKAFMSATTTTLQKPDGGVRGIATRTSFRWLVARMLTWQFWKAIEATCATFQLAFSTRAGTGCVRREIRTLTGAKPNDDGPVNGIDAYDNVRSAFLKKLQSAPNLQRVIPFVRATFSHPTNYVWEDEASVLHRIVHSEGSEQ